MSRHNDDALVAAFCRQSEALLERLGFSDTLTLSWLHQRIEQHRGRTIHLIAYDLPALAPHGFWVAGERDDYIFFDRKAPPARRQQIIAHEYGHMVFDDEGSSTELGELATTVIGPTDSVVSSQTCQRTVYEELREQRAELFGTVVVGSTVRAWRPRPTLGRLSSWICAFLAARRLRPLWTAIHAVVPEIAVLPRYTGISAWHSALRQAPLRWVRLPIEILDGYALLAPWMSSRALQTAHHHAQLMGLRGDDLAVTVEAAVLASALRARHRQEPPAAHPAPPFATGFRNASTGGSALTDHVAWLTRVGRAMRGSPVVAVTLAAVDDGQKSSGGPMPSRPTRA